MTKTQFRLLVVFVFVINFADIGLAELFGDPKAELAREYLDSLDKEQEGFFSLIRSLLFIMVNFFAYSIAMIGILFFKGWARTLYAITFILQLPFYVIAGITVRDALGSFTYDIIAWGHGAILALLYFSPIKELIKSKS